eukprot:5552050-Pleurochrysis_carterae.AAC.2
MAGSSCRRRLICASAGRGEHGGLGLPTEQQTTSTPIDHGASGALAPLLAGRHQAVRGLSVQDQLPCSAGTALYVHIFCTLTAAQRWDRTLTLLQCGAAGDGGRDQGLHLAVRRQLVPLRHLAHPGDGRPLHAARGPARAALSYPAAGNAATRSFTPEDLV